MLTGQAIADAMMLGLISINPWPSRWGANSIDLTLDSQFYVPSLESLDETINLADEGDVADMWMKHDCAPRGRILIRPGETVLGQTREVVGTKYPYVAKMYARSTVARLGLSVCKCAGLGDVGYIGKWTMEITNHNLRPVLLPVGARVAQMAFFRVEGPWGNEYDGQYQTGIVLPKALRVEA